MKEGRVKEIIGVVIDVDFTGQELPPIYNALEVVEEDRPGEERLILEVQQHLGENLVRCVAMDSSDGLTRGARRPIWQPCRRRESSSTLPRDWWMRPRRAFYALSCLVYWMRRRRRDSNSRKG